MQSLVLMYIMTIGCTCGLQELEMQLNKALKYANKEQTKYTDDINGDEGIGNCLIYQEICYLKLHYIYVTFEIMNQINQYCISVIFFNAVLSSLQYLKFEDFEL